MKTFGDKPAPAPAPTVTMVSGEPAAPDNPLAIYAEQSGGLQVGAASEGGTVYLALFTTRVTNSDMLHRLRQELPGDMVSGDTYQPYVVRNDTILDARNVRFVVPEAYEFKAQTDGVGQPEKLASNGTDFIHALVIGFFPIDGKLTAVPAVARFRSAQTNFVQRLRAAHDSAALPEWVNKPGADKTLRGALANLPVPFRVSASIHVEILTTKGAAKRHYAKLSPIVGDTTLDEVQALKELDPHEFSTVREKYLIRVNEAKGLPSA